MAETVLQGADIELLIREKNTGSFKAMVCEQTVTLNVKSNITTEKSKCGPFKGLTTPDFTLSGAAVFNATPTGSELSYNEALDFQLGLTLCEFILRNKAVTGYAAGEMVRMSGDVYFSDTTFDGSDGVVAKFTWAMEGSGTLNAVES